jgi:NAD+ diphosphatase
MNDPITFAGSPLDRSTVERRDPAWLEQHLADPGTRYLPLWKLDPLVKLGDPRCLAWARREIFEGGPPEPLLLGLADGVAHFAVNVSALSDPIETLGVDEVARFEELRGIAADLTPAELSIVAHARSLTDWHNRYRHCASCGGETFPLLGGAHRRCPDCAAEHFPRTDPVAISVVARGDRCLLGRGHGWPDTMYSALAGFVEPGETFEEAARREIREESGVVVGAVRYVKSQPWPFPSSLMIGCIAEAETETITLDTTELADARWFSLAEIRAALAGEKAPLFVPPPMAIAHHLIRAWAESRD